MTFNEAIQLHPTVVFDYLLERDKEIPQHWTARDAFTISYQSNEPIGRKLAVWDAYHTPEGDN